MRETAIKEFRLKMQIAQDAVLAIVFSAVLVLAGALLGNTYHLFLRLVLYALMAFALVIVLDPRKAVFSALVGQNRMTTILSAALVTAISLSCGFLMSINPIWNGEQPEYRNQYEELANSLLEGRLTVHDDEDVSALLALGNPYDPAQRAASGVEGEWDHSFYEGHYFVYFGIVPALILFMPYQAIVGSPLTTWKATAIFSFLVVGGLFATGYSVIRARRLKVPLVLYLLTCTGLSILVLWYPIKYPALYCTAITGGLAFFIWSFFFAWKAVHTRGTRRGRLALASSLCGALVFGCRPPIGLAELVLAPLYWSLIFPRRTEDDGGSRGISLSMMAAILVPIIVVASLLMEYNVVRFGSPFEFGQSYQITVADERPKAGGMLSGFSVIGWFGCVWSEILAPRGFDSSFPWVREASGLLPAFPILAFGWLRWRIGPEERMMRWLHFLLVLVPFVVLELQALSSTSMFVRYRLDYVLLWCLALVFWVFLEHRDGGLAAKWPQWFDRICCVSFLAILVVCGLLFFAHGDAAIADVVPSIVEKASRLLVVF